jgi:hypothetical protein
VAVVAILALSAHQFIYYLELYKYWADFLESTVFPDAHDCSRGYHFTNIFWLMNDFTHLLTPTSPHQASMLNGGLGLIFLAQDSSSSNASSG